MIVETMR